MGFLKRMMGGGDGEDSTPGPDWAQPMSQLDVADFTQAVEGDLARRGVAYSMGDGQVRVERSGSANDYGLSNLAQLCYQVGRREWAAAIGSHFDNLFAATDAEAEMHERARTFDGVRDMFKVRLYPGANLGGMDPEPPARWELAPGLTAAFVYDLPTTVSTASPEQVAGWGIAHEELLAVALGNVRADAVETQTIGEAGPSAAIGCVADHFFAASHALLLGEKLPTAAAGHAVFTVPHRHALLYAPMVDVSIITSINQLIPIGVSMFQQGPGSISPGLYWWRDGAVILLPSEFDGQKLNFAPPDEFVQVLNTLPAPD
jgi:hypothetical protein